MSGIIDSKSRVLDTIVTLEGRRQLALGGLDARYVSFTDGGTFYAADITSGSQDATARIYFESCQLPQDSVTFRANDAGELQALVNASGIPMSNGGQILEYSFKPQTSLFVGATIQSVSALTGDALSVAADAVLGSAAENFDNLRLIASQNAMFEQDGFEAGPNDVTFTVTNDRPVPTEQFVTNVDSLSSVFADPRFSNVTNFKHLPPISATNKRPLALYTLLGLSKPLSFAQMMRELHYYESLGQMHTVRFDPTSIANNVVGQFFEVSSDKVSKLDVIDYGVHDFTSSHTFFVGKCVVDRNGTDTFIHLFTLVFTPA